MRVCQLHICSLCNVCIMHSGATPMSLARPTSWTFVTRVICAIYNEKHWKLGTSELKSMWNVCVSELWVPDYWKSWDWAVSDSARIVDEFYTKCYGSVRSILLHARLVFYCHKTFNFYKICIESFGFNSCHPYDQWEWLTKWLSSSVFLRAKYPLDHENI